MEHLNKLSNLIINGTITTEQALIMIMEHLKDDTARNILIANGFEKKTGDDRIKELFSLLL